MKKLKPIITTCTFSLPGHPASNTKQSLYGLADLKQNKAHKYPPSDSLTILKPNKSDRENKITNGLLLRSRGGTTSISLGNIKNKHP